MIRIAHLINPVKFPVYSDLNAIQHITFESIRVAREKATNQVDVELLTAQFPEDHEVIPDYFIKTPDLNRSVIDFGQFSQHKKFPLLRDLLQRLFEGSDAEYLIYSNVDIAVQPHFYEEVARRLKSGHDALIINRRRIPGHFSEIDQLPELYLTKGASHPGFDCFVFHRSMFPRFHLKNVCVGIPYVGITFSQNLFCLSHQFKLLDREYLTFHIGMDVFKKRDREYLSHNRREFWKAMNELGPQLDSRRFPWGDKNLIYRMIRWGAHPSIPILLAIKLEPRRWKLGFLQSTE
jgi:hypothetical protein